MAPCARVRYGLAAALLAFMLAASGLAPAAGLWTENATEALAQAAKEKKDLLIDFTGSDWCGWCIRLDREVFSQPAFVAQAPKQFVFLKIDFPRSTPQSEELKKQNQEWQAKYPVRGYPTIVLADGAGKPYAATGYRAGGAEAYLKHLDEFRKAREKRDAAVAKARSAEGIEKAKLLDQGLSALDPALVTTSYGDVIEEIVKLDPENKAGLKTKYAAIALMNQIGSALREKQFDQAISLADEALKSLGDTGQPAQDIGFMKAMALNSKKDKTGAKKALDAALKAAPEGSKAPQIKAVLERFFKDTE